MQKSTRDQYIFIADFFVNEVIGGGELNNEEAINILKHRNCNVSKINSHLVTVDFIKKNLDKKFIVANFINLDQNSKDLLFEKAKYLIYEHDHKYLKTRDPSIFKDFLAPKEFIINEDFFKNATAILCQSKMHTEIIKKNLNYNNIINLGGNLWPEDTLNYIEDLSTKKKEKKVSIMQSTNPIKNTQDAIRFCKIKNMEYELIAPQQYKNFLTSLSKNDTFIFFPKTAETLSRVIVEARMMGMTTITNKLIGATSEEWFKFKGKELIDIMREKRNSIVNIIEETF